MKKSVILFGLAISFVFLTSCTTDDLDQNLNNSNINFEEEMNQNLYQRDNDTIVFPNVNMTTSSVDGDPIVKPKNG
ncbi:MAG: hypothetical protein ABNG98_09430 [Flavobacterium sp.]|jgi:hypothetical protein